MPSNILIMPLVGAFLFVRICFLTRYRAQSLQGYRLLLEISTFGLLFFGLSRLTVVVLKRFSIGLELQRLWRDMTEIPYSATGVGCIIVALVAAHAVNFPVWETWRRAFKAGKVLKTIRVRGMRVVDIRKRSVRFRLRDNICFWRPKFWENAVARTTLKKYIALNWATTKQKNHLLRLLNEAGRTGAMVSVSLVSRKFYIGFVVSVPSLDPNEVFFRLYPVRSGYREKDNLRFEMTTDYEQVQADRGENLTFVVIPMRDVQTANPFDPDAYARYFKHKEPAGAVFE